MVRGREQSGGGEHDDPMTVNAEVVPAVVHVIAGGGGRDQVAQARLPVWPPSLCAGQYSHVVRVPSLAINTTG